MRGTNACHIPPLCLLDLPAILLPVSFASQRLLGPELLARFQVEGVPFNLLDNVLLLDLALETAKGVFERLALLKLNFSQTNYTSQLDQNFPCAFPDFRDPASPVVRPDPKFPTLRTEGTDIIGG